MAIDPSNYDVDELRNMVRPGHDADRVYGEGGFLWPVTPPDVGEPGPEATKEWERMVSGHTTKPFLEGVPDGEEADQIAFEWLEFLQAEAGYEGCLDALRYYRSIEWITGDAEEDLQNYLLGVGRQPGNGVDDLDRRDHMRSLAYIARLSART